MTDGVALASGAGVAIAAFTLAWMARSGKYPSFGRWWDGEGATLAVLLTILFFAIFGSRYL